MAAWRAFIPIWLFVAPAWAAPPVTTGPDSAAIRAPVFYADSANADANLELREKEFEHRTYTDSMNAALRRDELEQRKVEANRQKCYWIATLVAGFIAVSFGFVLNAWRNWVSQGTAKLTHLDETFRTYLERFSDRKQSAGVRIGASIGLTNLSNNRDPLRLRKHYSLREDTVHLFVESLATETHPDVLAAIRDRLVEIGHPALQILVNKDREWFAVGWTRSESGTYEPPRWMPLTKREEPHTPDDHEIDLDRLSAHFRASRDAIARIIKQAKKPGHLARPSKRRSVREWFRKPWPRWSDWWLEYRALRRRRWLDASGLDEMAFVKADLSSPPTVVHLEYASLDRACFEHATLFGARLDHAVLRGARLDQAILIDAHLEHADLIDAHLEHAYLPWAHLEHATLLGGHLEHAHVREAHLEHAVLSRARLEHAVLSRAHLEHADLRDAHLEHANLSEAHLEHADLPAAHLEHADLSGGRLDHANVQGCALRDAEKRESATYTGANWWDAGTKEQPLTDEQGAWFEEHYPRKENEPEFLKYWKKNEFGWYERREGT